VADGQTFNQQQSFWRRYANSPRAQRRALTVGLALFALGVAAIVVAFFRNTGHQYPDKLSNQPAQVYHQPKTVALDPQIIKVARKFILTAVARKNIASSFDIVGRDLRGSMTRAEWAKGNIPVVYYPADRLSIATFRVDYSHPREALLEIGLVPAKGVDVKRLTFFIGFQKVGTGAQAHWVVNYWSPHYKPPVPLSPR
jgi:hypothetical protein